MKTIILASQSMFRKEMMEQAQIPFEVIISDADETPTEGLSFEEQLAEISMRKAQTVLEMTKDRGRRIIVAADQNIIFDGVSYGKPKTVEDAKFLIVKMMGRDVYSYTGNTVIYADGEKIIDCIWLLVDLRSSMFRGTSWHNCFYLPVSLIRNTNSSHMCR